MRGLLIGALVVAVKLAPAVNAADAPRQAPAPAPVSAQGPAEVPAQIPAQVPAQFPAQLAAPDPNAPPIVDIALRQIRAASGGSSIARSMVRGNGESFLYAGSGPCIVGAADSDRALENSVTWRASGAVKSVERGNGVADVEWQRIEYRPSGAVAGPRVRMTLTMPLGERVAVDFVETPGDVCRTNALVFEIGIAADHGSRLAMSAEGRAETASAGARAGGGGGGRGGGGRGTRDTPDQIERRRLGAEAARSASIVTRPMPPRQYRVDVWLVVPGASAPSEASKPPLSQRMSQIVGGTGGRFVFPQVAAGGAADRPITAEISAFVIPVTGDQIIIAITRYPSSIDGPPLLSAGWLKVVPMPGDDDVLSFPLPGVEPSATPASPAARQIELRVKIAKR